MITHEWNGTILTITSDSGTSSMDLQGPPGNKGCRGPQGRAGCIVNADGSVDMTGYATETYVDEKLADVQGADLNNYYTKAETKTLIDNIDLTGYATETYVQNQISAIPAPDLSGYALKTEIPSTDGLATETYVDNAVNGIDLTGYYTKTEVDSAISAVEESIPAPVDLTGYATENYVTTKIAAAQLEGAGIDMSGYATTEYVDNAVAGASGGVGQAGTGTNAEIFNDYTNNIASGNYSHAEGFKTKATKMYSHAEGSFTSAIGSSSHAEGYQTKATGSNSHAEGSETEAFGNSSHAEGHGTIAQGAYSHVQGKYNIEGQTTYAHIVGNGTSNINRSNCHTLDWNGNAWFAGKVYVGGTSMNDATELGTGTGTTTSIWYVNVEINSSNEITSIDKTLKEIQTAYKAGNNVIAKVRYEPFLEMYEYLYMPLIGYYEGISVCFGNNTCVSDWTIAATIVISTQGNTFYSINITPNDYALKTDIPSNVSAFTNDAGYLTEHQSLSNYYTKTEVDNAIASAATGDVDLSSYATKEYVTGLGYQTEAQVLALIQANMPSSGDEVSY